MSHDSSDERRSMRSKVRFAGTIEFDRQKTRISILDISEHGGLIQGSKLPAEESEISPSYRQSTFAGWIVWKRQDFAGVHFREQTSPGALKKPEVSTSDMIVKDARTGSFKRPGFRGDLLSDEEKQLLREWLQDD